MLDLQEMLKFCWEYASNEPSDYQKWILIFYLLAN